MAPYSPFSPTKILIPSCSLATFDASDQAPLKGWSWICLNLPQLPIFFVDPFGWVIFCIFLGSSTKYEHRLDIQNSHLFEAISSSHSSLSGHFPPKILDFYDAMNTPPNPRTQDARNATPPHHLIFDWRWHVPHLKRYRSLRRPIPQCHPLQEMAGLIKSLWGFGIGLVPLGSDGGSQKYPLLMTSWKIQPPPPWHAWSKVPVASNDVLQALQLCWRSQYVSPVGETWKHGLRERCTA